MNYDLAGAKVQGFTWQKLIYTFNKPDIPEYTVELLFDESVYNTLLRRYQELSGNGGGVGEDNPYDLDGYITTIDTGKIDADYMNLHFEKFRNAFTEGDKEAQEQAKIELHKIFASLSQEEQKFANIILRDLETGNLIVDDDKTIQDLINSYMNKETDSTIQILVDNLGIDEAKLREMIALQLTEDNIDEFSRFTELMATVDKKKAKIYLESIEGKAITPLKVGAKISAILKKFIIEGVFSK